MALDRDELARRRQARQEQRLARQAKRKKLFIRLTIAAAVLVLCAVIITLVARSVQEKKRQELAKEHETTVIHLTAAGDLNINNAVVNSGGGVYDYSGTFLDVAHLLANADVSTVNFEGVLCGEPYGDSKSAPPSLVKSLADCGVDLVQLANSYSIYKGVSGLSTTISAIRSAGMEPLGVYANAQEYENGKGYTICNVRGIKIAFIAFTKGMDGMALPAGSEDCVNVLYTDYASTYQEVDTEGITSVIKAAQKEDPDLIVAMLHWGSEFNDTVSTSQKTIQKLLYKNGVNVILGTHSHYVQKMDLDKDDNQFIAYSLGDFISDAQRSGTEYSVLLDLEITKDNVTGETSITGYSYTPIFTVAEEGKPLRVVRIREAMAAYEEGHIDAVSEQTYEAMKYALGRIEARIAGPKN